MDVMTRSIILKKVIRKLTDNVKKSECYSDQTMNLVDWEIILEAYRDKLNKPENTAG